MLRSPCTRRQRKPGGSRVLLIVQVLSQGARRAHLSGGVRQRGRVRIHARKGIRQGVQKATLRRQRQHDTRQTSWANETLLLGVWNEGG